MDADGFGLGETRMTHSDLTKALDHATPARVSPMAQWSMILGITSILTTVILIGPVIGVVAYILGSISGRAIQKNPGQLAGAGYAQTGRVTGILSTCLLVVGVILMPSLGHSGWAPRAACAANVTGTMKGLVVYANDNDGVYPTPGLPPADKAYSASLGTLSTATDPDGALGQIQTTPGSQGNPMSALWILVLRNQETPKNLICASERGRYPKASPTTDAAGRYYLNPVAADQVSYSIAYPYASATSVGGWWKNTTLSDLPIISDMAPLQGTGKPVRNLLPVGAPWDLKTVNSGNHNGDGQNVGFADAHCEWRANPLAGQKGESIWTVGLAAPVVGGYGGSVATGGAVPNYPPNEAAGVPLTEGFDTIMVPVRDLKTGAIK